VGGNFTGAGELLHAPTCVAWCGFILSSSPLTFFTHTPQQLLCDRSSGELRQLEIEYKWMVTMCKGMDISTSSRGTYKVHQQQFLDCCNAFKLDPLAITEEQLCMVVVHFALTHTTKSVKSYLSAVQKMYDYADRGPLPRGVKYTIFNKGLERLLGQADVLVRTRALSLDEVLDILQALDLTNPEHVCFGTQTMVAFLLCLRTEDHTNGRLRWGDVYLRPDDSVEFLLAPGKSVRHFRRTAIEAKPGFLSAAMWLKLHWGNLPPEGRTSNSPVFVSFKYANQGTYKASTADHYIKQLKYWVKKVLNCSPELYAGYSLRRGGVTEMMSAGVPLAIIKAHVGWTPNSSAHCTYYDHNGQL
jgi:hypothetical protein